MKKIFNKTNLSISILLVIITTITIFPQRIIDKGKGNHNHTKKGFMDGNLVETVYYNFGEIGDWQNEPTRSGVWPKGSGHTYVDGVAVMVQAEAKAPGGQVIHPLESNYYEFTRKSPSGVTYGWWPLPGYANPFQSAIARSDDENTWPTSWPDRPSDWDGQWNGFFGKNIKNADLETFFVFDDNEDRDYINKVNFRPDAEDTTRGGLGMQVRARGFQWSQVLAEDVIFWYYEITNMTTTDYSKTLFAEYVDWGVGGHDNSSNNAGDYDEVLDIAYAWSTVPVGSPGNWSPVGYSAYAFLESPGISDDNQDNDDDGVTDERRENNAVNFITNIANDPFIRNADADTLRFRIFYGYSWRPHWDADENANWRTYTDANLNGSWDEAEPLNDDVGADGIGQYDEGYTGRDEGEGNGRPDQGEPNFGILDKDESDQLGLTGFAIFPVHRYELHNDEENWNALSALPSPHGQVLSGVNLGNYFSSYLFHMFGKNTYSGMTGTTEETGETQRFSMSLIYGIDTDDLFRRKRTVQSIYNANYHFAKPPEKPIVKAIPGDQKVTLYWDSRAELTFDAFYQKYNFEGYKIYRSTEANFIENKIITDANGVGVFRKPIVTFDLVDGVKGLHPIDVNGAKFSLGNDSGLRHSFTDTTVLNGQTYYYAVVAYDQGFTSTNIQGEQLGIPPSETTSIIKVDVNGNYKTDINTAVVTPRAPSAGFIPAQINNFTMSGPGTGSGSVSVVDPDSLKSFETYRIEFFDSAAYHNNPHPWYRIVNYSTNDTLQRMTRFSGNDVQTLVLQGFSINMKNDTNVVVDFANSGWVEGSSNDIVTIGFDPRYANSFLTKRVNYPSDFEILFTEPGQGDSSFPASSFFSSFPSNITIKNLTEGTEHFQFVYYDPNNDRLFNAGDAIFLAFGDSAGKRATTSSDLHVAWSITLAKDTTLAVSDQIEPAPGDKIRITTRKPFRTGEYFEFTTQKSDFNSALAVQDMDKIAVVPNPYVGAASWEPNAATSGRGERRVYFIHLPRKCSIRIYTISGNLVQSLNHDSALDDGQEPWDLNTKDGMSLAFGVYVFHVEAEGIGSKIGKFAVIK